MDTIWVHLCFRHVILPSTVGVAILRVLLLALLLSVMQAILSRSTDTARVDYGNSGGFAVLTNPLEIAGAYFITKSITNADKKLKNFDPG